MKKVVARFDGRGSSLDIFAKSSFNDIKRPSFNKRPSSSNSLTATIEYEEKGSFGVSFYKYKRDYKKRTNR